MNKSVLCKCNILSKKHNKLLWCFVLGALLFANSCKQGNNSGLEEPIQLDEITITVKGDEGITLKKPNLFRVEKA